MYHLPPQGKKLISGVMVSVLTFNVVDRGFEPRSGQTKEYKIVFSASELSMQY